MTILLVQKHIKIVIFVLRVENGGDLIQFVQDYFNIGFTEALKKINFDFNLNLDFKKCSSDEFKKIELKLKIHRLKKEQEKQKYRNKMLNLCNNSRILEKTREEIKSQINPYNWEEIEEVCALLSEQIELLDLEFEELNKKNVDRI